MATYEIGGMNVRMTAAQADRWNRGDMTAYDLRRVVVAVPEPQNQARYISLRRATSPRLEPEIAEAMAGMPASRISKPTS